MHPSKSFHGSQGMDSDRCSLWMGPDSSGSQASFSAMAEEIWNSERADSTGPDRTGAIFSQARATCEPRQQPRSSREARLKVTKLEKALEVMGDADGPAVECLKGELEKAQQCGEEATSPAGGGRVPQVHHSVREALLRAGRRTPFRGEGTRRGERFGAVGNRAGRSPKGGLARSRAPGGVGCRGPEITRGIDASARRSQSRSCCPILPKFRPRLPICCRRGLQNVVQELRSQCPPIHKTWNGGYQKNMWSSAMPSSLGTKSRFWR